MGGSELHWLSVAIGEGLLTLAGESIPCLKEASLNVLQRALAMRLGHPSNLKGEEWPEFRIS